MSFSARTIAAQIRTRGGIADAAIAADLPDSVGCWCEASRQGEFPEHVATIIAIIDQYAESAIGDRHYFCDQPDVLLPGEPMR